MSEHKPAKTLPLAVSDAALPQGSLQYLSGLPLLTAEDKDKYSRLHRDIFQAVEPSDFFEQLWVRDILQHVWEAERYRGFLVALIKGSEFRALEMFCGLLSTLSVKSVWNLWAGEDLKLWRDNILRLIEMP